MGQSLAGQTPYRDGSHSGTAAMSAARALLDALAQQLGEATLAVLAGAPGERAVVLDLRGADEPPWPDPLSGDSALARVWADGETLASTSLDGDPQRAHLVLPVTDDEGARLGVVIADREAARPFSSEEVAAVVALVDRHRAALHDAIEADRLHHQAAHEERDRLARELHDGLAQELVALGYRVDYVRRQASRNGSLLAGSLDDVRAELTHVLGDLRLRISDLHVCPGPGHGLEEILDERLGQFAEASGLVVDLAVSQNGYALPYAVQSLIHRLLLDVLSDARHAPGATRLELQLDLVAPAARLRAAHDGAGTLDARDLAHHPLTALGAVIGVGHPRPQGVELTLHLGSPGAGAGRRHATERTILRS